MTALIDLALLLPLPAPRFTSPHPGSEAHTIVICNAILNSEVMTDDQTEAMVDRLAKHMNKGLAV